MPPNPPGATGNVPDAPSMLDMIRLSPRVLLPPGGVDLYRHIAILTDMDEEDEVLDVACGKGAALEYFVREYGVHGSGVDPDPRMVQVAEDRTRGEGLAARVQFQTGRPNSLPYRDDIFDVVVGELALAASVDAAAAVRELVRVTKPGGSVVLIQLVWKAPVEPERQRVLAQHLGARPMMLVEWRRLLRDAGVVDLHTEDWSDEHTSFRASAVKPFYDFAEIFSFTEKVGVLRRAWARWGWRGVRTVLARERDVHRLLTRERALGLDLIKGRKAAAALSPEPTEGDGEDHDARDEAVAGVVPGARGGGARPRRKSEEGEDAGTAGLPLFGNDDREG